MITIKSENKPDQIVIPTIFPDSSSQIWKLDLDQYERYEESYVKIVWNFESEAELFQLLQLVMLLDSENIHISEIYIPYLPYGRQDKNINNELTFAKFSFLRIMDSIVGYCGASITTLDVHSNSGNYILNIHSYSPKTYIDKAIKEFKADVLVYPDEGAYNRYGNLYPEYNYLVLDKVRDQKTGWIMSLKLNEQLSTTILRDASYKFLIIDDICDGGATFERASKYLHQNYFKINHITNSLPRNLSEVGLYVTHGIFSKDFEGMIDSGISKFYTTQSLIQNVNGYKLQEVKGE